MTPTFEAEVFAQPADIAGLTDRILEFLDERGVDARAAHHAAMAIEEILTNLGTHGGCSDQPAIVRVSVSPAHVDGEIRDRGFPFDPRTSPEPDLSQGIEASKIGGLGLHLLRKLATHVGYSHDAGTNCTTFAIPRHGP